MSVIFTGTNQGSFTSTGNNVTIQLPSGFYWIWVKNLTVSYSTTAGGAGAEFYWQNGMVQGQGTQYTKATAANGVASLGVCELLPNAGFFYVNNTINIPGGVVATTAVSNGTPPVVSTATPPANGSIVRLFNMAGATQLNGIDFTTAGYDSATSFELAYMQPIASTASAGQFRVIPYNPYFYPAVRYITNISQASQAIITLSVTHTFQVGQQVNVVVPTVFGMVQLNQIGNYSGSQATYPTIVAVGQADTDGYTNTITVNVNTSAFNAFTFPLTGSAGFTPAQVVPVGENTAQALASNTDILADSEVNQGLFGVQLIAGAGSPAGVNGNVIFWVAGKSFSVNNLATGVV